MSEKKTLRLRDAVLNELAKLENSWLDKSTAYGNVALKYGVKGTTIRQWVKRYGIPNNGLKFCNGELHSVTENTASVTENTASVTDAVTPVTSADIVDGIMNKYGKKGDDYITAFDRAPKTNDGAVLMKNGSKVYF